MDLRIVTDKDFNNERYSDAIYLLSDVDIIMKAYKLNVPVVILAKDGIEKYPILSKTVIVEEESELTEDYLRKVYNRFYGISNVVLTTERLVIREETVDDVEEMYKVYEDPSVTEYMEGLYENHDEERLFISKYIENMYGFYDYGLWVLEDRKSHVMVGRAGLSHRVIDGVSETELGYVIRKEYQGCGLAYEASKAILDYAKTELKKEEIFVCTDTDNLPSIKLAYKLGFKEYAKVDEFTLLKCNL